MQKETAKIFNLAYITIHVLVALGFVLKKQPIFVFSPAITSVIYIGLMITERYTDFRLSNFTRAILIISIAGHNLLGEYYDFYTKVKEFDKFLHMFGTFSFALFAFELLKHFIGISTDQPKVLTFIIVLVLGISQGAIFELEEFFIDVVTQGRNQGGLYDTNMDLLYDSIGAALAGLMQIRIKPLSGYGKRRL